jgi:hypothetical protein
MIDPELINQSGGDWGQYGELTGSALLQLIQQDKLRVVFANDSLLVWVQRGDGTSGTYRLVHTDLASEQQGQLSSELDHVWSFQELLPLFQKYGQQYGFDYRVIAGIAYQESGFKNWRVHADGTGFGLFGLDDNGLLPDFERWSGLSVGRGASHRPVTPNQQIEYAAYQLARYQTQLGDPILAAQAWHRGMGGYADSLGVNYGNLIRSHITRLFGT